MKIKTINIEETESCTVEFALFLNKNKDTKNLTYRYYCPKCHGHGCNKVNDRCRGGMVVQPLSDLNDLNEFEESEKNKIKDFITDLYNTFVQKHKVIG